MKVGINIIYQTIFVNIVKLASKSKSLFFTVDCITPRTEIIFSCLFFKTILPVLIGMFHYQKYNLSL